MKLIGYHLDSHKESERLIDGFKLSLKLGDVSKIINFFKNQNKWNEYYYHEIGDFDLNVDQVNNILNLEVDFWKDKDVLFDFSGFTLEFEKEMLKSYDQLIFQSYDKNFKKKSHYYTCWLNDVECIHKSGIEINKFLPKFLVEKFENKNRIFDISNYNYRLEYLPLNELYFINGINDNFKLDLSFGYEMDDD